MQTDCALACSAPFQAQWAAAGVRSGGARLAPPPKSAHPLEKVCLYERAREACNTTILQQTAESRSPVACPARQAEAGSQHAGTGSDDGRQMNNLRWLGGGSRSAERGRGRGSRGSRSARPGGQTAGGRRVALFTTAARDRHPAAGQRWGEVVRVGSACAPGRGACAVLGGDRPPGAVRDNWLSRNIRRRS